MEETKERVKTLVADILKKYHNFSDASIEKAYKKLDNLALIDIVFDVEASFGLNLISEGVTDKMKFISEMRERSFDDFCEALADHIDKEITKGVVNE